ncbi:hypothetical protein HK101_002589 [Irineochytrium annulatum]|nr:hypothetical protein HK101_002589 [Irineochytrium annulatum]
MSQIAELFEEDDEDDDEAEGDATYEPWTPEDIHICCVFCGVPVGLSACETVGDDFFVNTAQALPVGSNNPSAYGTIHRTWPGYLKCGNKVYDAIRLDETGEHDWAVPAHACCVDILYYRMWKRDMDCLRPFTDWLNENSEEVTRASRWIGKLLEPIDYGHAVMALDAWTVAMRTAKVSLSMMPALRSLLANPLLLPPLRITHEENVVHRLSDVIAKVDRTDGLPFAKANARLFKRMKRLSLVFYADEELAADAQSADIITPTTHISKLHVFTLPKTQTGIGSLSLLPLEIIAHISTFLTAAALVRLEMTCHTACTFVRSPHLSSTWQILCLQRGWADIDRYGQLRTPHCPAIQHPHLVRWREYYGECSASPAARNFERIVSLIECILDAHADDPVWLDACASDDDSDGGAGGEGDVEPEDEADWGWMIHPLDLNEVIAAVRRGRWPAARLYLARGGDPDALGTCGTSLLYRAVEADHVRVMETLQAAGCSFEADYPDGRNILTVAAASGSLTALRALLNFAGEKRWGLAERDKGGLTPLMAALMHGREEIAEYLVELGEPLGIEADVVLLACKKASPTLIRLILPLRSPGCDLNAANEDGRMLVSHVVERGDDFTEVLQILVDAGVDVNATDTDGKTAYDVAIAWADGSHAAALSAFGGRPAMG